jgi:hypothetical protein
MKKLFLLLILSLGLITSPFANVLYKSSCETTHSFQGFDNTWIVEIDEEKNYYSVKDIHASQEFSTANGDLNLLGKVDGHYYLSLRNGYLYIYATPWEYRPNSLRVIDVRGDKDYVFALCDNIK